MKLAAGVGLLAFALLGAGFFFWGSPKERPKPTGPVIIPNDMLNVASTKMGAEIFKTCASCHSTRPEGSPNMVGPSLFGIVGAPIASRSGYEYSEALIKLRGRIWTTDELDRWLHSPSAYAPGSKMRFGGLLDPQDRWDLIAYLITLK